MATPRKLPATAVEVIKHSATLVSYRFKTEKRVPKFNPGQFLHLALDPYDPSKHWPDSRVFSIASSPDRRDQVDIVISVKGFFTQRMYNEIEKGNQVWLKLPYGDFTFDSLERPVVLIAGGTGISPFVSFLKNQIRNPAGKFPIRLYYGIRNKELFLFNSTIEAAHRQIPDFKATIYAEETFPAADRSGMLDIKNIHLENDPLNPVYFLSGPLPMIQAFRSQLQEYLVADEDIRIDAWE